MAPDHIVVAARSLEEGAAWCEATLGATPVEGGRHANMATHNRLLGLGNGAGQRMYLEIIALDPDAPAPARARWFDLDSPRLQAAIAAGPRLVHWVVRCNDIDRAIAALRGAGHDPGDAIAAERMTAHGLLRWRISLRDDGRRPAGGAVPLLIEWGDAHPCDRLPASGVSVARIELGGVDPGVATLLGASPAASGSPPLVVSLDTPRGRVELVAA
ncbi:MAG: VOC family protein [Caldimonas sp.]